MHSARINTLGERVEDIFLVDGSRLTQDNKLQLALEGELLGCARHLSAQPYRFRFMATDSDDFPGDDDKRRAGDPTQPAARVLPTLGVRRDDEGNAVRSTGKPRARPT